MDTPTVVAKPKNFEMVDMTVNKQDIINNMIEVFQATMQKSIDEVRDQIKELSDFSDLVSKSVKDKIASEVKANKVVKDFINAKVKLMNISNDVNTQKVSMKVDASYRNGDVNVGVIYQEKHTTLYFGTSEERAQRGTIDLNKVSATAKKVHTEMTKRLKQIDAKNLLLEKQMKEAQNFSRNRAQVKLDFDKKILAQTAEGKKFLVELAKIEKNFKNIK